MNMDSRITAMAPKASQKVDGRRNAYFSAPSEIYIKIPYNTYTDCQHDFLFLRPRAALRTCFHISFISSIQICSSSTFSPIECAVVDVRLFSMVTCFFFLIFMILFILVIIIYLYRLPEKKKKKKFLRKPDVTFFCTHFFFY